MEMSKAIDIAIEALEQRKAQFKRCIHMGINGWDQKGLDEVIEAIEKLKSIKYTN